jgi:hypothetical protein
MTVNKLTPETRAALVGIIRRAANRGREIREQKRSADLGELGGQTQAGGTSAPTGQSAEESIADVC